MSGGLYDPLGAARPVRTQRWRPSVALVTVATIAAALAILGFVVALRGGGERGEPGAVVTIERSPPPAPPPPAAALPIPPADAVSGAPPSAPVAPAPLAPLAVSPASGDADVEIQNGVRIIRMRPQPTKSSGPGPTPPIAATTETSRSQGTQIPRTH